MGYSDENSLIALARLLDNKIYMSVEGLSTTLGQTNAVVDALLKRLPAYGVHLQVSDDKKFRLVQPISWLSAKNIYAYDPRLMKDHQITVVNVTESTNTDLISLKQNH